MAGRACMCNEVLFARPIREIRRKNALRNMAFFGPARRTARRPFDGPRQSFVTVRQKFASLIQLSMIFSSSSVSLFRLINRIPGRSQV